MKRRNMFVAALAVVLLTPVMRLKAQATLYVEGSADYLKGGPYADFLYGGTAGFTMDLVRAVRDRVTLSADAQGVFVDNNSTPGGGLASDEAYDAVTIGPRLSLTPRAHGLSPYLQLNVGFARYHDPNVHSATDFVIGGQAGVTRRLTSHLDAVLDYSYTDFGYNFGYYSPQAFSVGVAYRFAKR